LQQIAGVLVHFAAAICNLTIRAEHVIRLLVACLWQASCTLIQVRSLPDGERAIKIKKNKQKTSDVSKVLAGMC